MYSSQNFFLKTSSILVACLVLRIIVKSPKTNILKICVWFHFLFSPTNFKYANFLPVLTLLKLLKVTYLLTYLLTYSKVQSPSWAANLFAASQEIPRISRKPKVHYRTHKRPPPVSILGQPIPVHIPTSHLLEIHPNIIHPSTPRSPQWSPSLRFPSQEPIHTLSSPNTCYIPSPSHSSRFYHPQNIGWGVQII